MFSTQKISVHNVQYKYVPCSSTININIKCSIERVDPLALFITRDCIHHKG